MYTWGCLSKFYTHFVCDYITYTCTYSIFAWAFKGAARNVNKRDALWVGRGYMYFHIMASGCMQFALMFDTCIVQNTVKHSGYSE